MDAVHKRRNEDQARAAWLWVASRIALAGGIFGGFCALRALGRSVPAADAVRIGLVAATGFGALMAVAAAIGLRRQHADGPLTASERLEVLHAVATGGDIGDPRLASAVIDHAGVVQRSLGQRGRGTWLGGLVVASSLAVAVKALVGGSPGPAAASAAIAPLVVALLLIRPRRTAQRHAHAIVAETAARRLRPTAAASPAGQGDDG